MTITVAPSAACILSQADELWPDRDHASDGTVGDFAHSQRISDHNPDANGVVHAADLDHDPAHGCDNDENSLEHLYDWRLKYRIWARRIWNLAIAPYWRPYYGENPHVVEMHTSVNSGPSETDVSPWFDAAAGGDLMPGDADRIISTVGQYEQDTRKLLIGVMERIADDQRAREGKRTRRLLDAIAAHAAGDVHALEALAAAPDDDGPTAAESTAAFIAEIEKVAADLDAKFLAAPTEETSTPEKAAAFVEKHRTDLETLAATAPTPPPAG